MIFATVALVGIAAVSSWLTSAEPPAAAEKKPQTAIGEPPSEVKLVQHPATVR